MGGSRSRNPFPGIGRNTPVVRHVSGPMAGMDVHRRSAGTEGLRAFRRRTRPCIPARRVEKRMRQNQSQLVTAGRKGEPQRCIAPRRAASVLKASMWVACRVHRTSHHPRMYPYITYIFRRRRIWRIRMLHGGRHPRVSLARRLRHHMEALPLTAPPAKAVATLH